MSGLHWNFLPACVLALTLFNTSLSAAPAAGNGGMAFDETAPASLSNALRTVIEQHPRRRAAQAQLQARRAALRAADKALYNPELELDTEKTGVRTSYIQLSQTIDMGDRRGSRTHRAEAQLLGAEAGYERAMQELARDLLAALAEQRTREALADLARQGLGLMREFSDIAERRFRAGDLTQVELDLARLAYSEALMTQAQALSEAAAANEALQAIFIRLPASLPELPDELPRARLPEDADFIRSLPLMRILEAEVAAKRHTVALRKSERSWDPTIALRGGKEDSESLVGATLSIPLNVRNSFRAEVEEAQQELIRAEQLAQQTFRDQRARVRATSERYRLLQQAWDNWRRSGRISVERQLELIKKIWRAGDMSTTEYLVQLKQALDTRAAGYELRGRVWLAGFDWLLATASIDDWLQLPLEGEEK